MGVVTLRKGSEVVYVDKELQPEALVAFRKQGYKEAPPPKPEPVPESVPEPTPEETAAATEGAGENE